MAEDKVQEQRFELKYRISRETALGVREFARSYLEPDEFSPINQPGKGDRTESLRYAYSIHSIYLDSESLQLYWDVINTNKNRYKLRVRYYDEDPASPVFFEIKRRVNAAILKQRCAVRREAVPRILAGHLPKPEHLLSTKPQSLVAIQQFSRLMHDLHATPKTHVAYLREAWVTPESNAVRLCLDRQVASVPHFTVETTTRMENPVMPFEPDVILELKFTGRFPNWYRTLTETFGLMQCSAAKYADGVAHAGEHRFASGALSLEREDLVERSLSRWRADAGQPAAV
jgi:SPX domain protein involved in polyphosphate accumulation